ncbi:hypothetical protein M422DRAFT_256950 [Sphaerobolus stellatus SS14]|uniref:Uncharacterized protein n=1 Tax=Sphaerobolus stellatus (strain SS14) TaxID=990650 RepID=A0A0C9VQE3_SPHS4|nr:hypothetical protein M422DRAFT_256950 [Sphaerobolus stellatus SS14]
MVPGDPARQVWERTASLLLNSTLSALPHATIADDVYEGYWIQYEQNSNGRSRKILHDSESYAHPYTFRPERFIPEENGGVAERDPLLEVLDMEDGIICAGKNLVAASVWVSIATTFSAFDWSDPVDESGQMIDHIRAVQPSSSIGSFRPMEFTVQFIPRLTKLKLL